MEKSYLKSGFHGILFNNILDFIKHVSRISFKEISPINKIWILYHKILKIIIAIWNHFKIWYWEYNWVPTFKQCVTVLSICSRLLSSSKSNFQTLGTKLSNNQLLNHQSNAKKKCWIYNLRIKTSSEVYSILDSKLRPCQTMSRTTWANIVGPISNYSVFHCYRI